MPAFSLSNDIEFQTQVTSAEHQQNYTEIESFINSNLIHSDGYNGMDDGVELLLGADATVAMGAATKQQLDAAATAAQANLDALAQANNAFPASGERLYIEARSVVGITDSDGRLAVGFNNAFLSDPVIVFINGDRTTGDWIPSIWSSSTTGFVANTGNPAVAVRVDYIAIGMRAD